MTSRQGTIPEATPGLPTAVVAQEAPAAATTIAAAITRSTILERYASTRQTFLW
jgi:hypothetical protein